MYYRGPWAGFKFHGGHGGHYLSLLRFCLGALKSQYMLWTYGMLNHVLALRKLSTFLKWLQCPLNLRPAQGYVYISLFAGHIFRDLQN